MKGLATDTKTELNRIRKDRDNYKGLLDDVSEDLGRSRRECVSLKKSNDSLSVKARKRGLIIIMLILGLAFVAAFGIWSHIRAIDYKSFSGEVKAAVADSPLAADLIPDSVRYDYERLFKTIW